MAFILLLLKTLKRLVRSNTFVSSFFVSSSQNYVGQLTVVSKREIINCRFSIAIPTTFKLQKLKWIIITIIIIHIN